MRKFLIGSLLFFFTAMVVFGFAVIFYPEYTNWEAVRVYWQMEEDVEKYKEEQRMGEFHEILVQIRDRNLGRNPLVAEQLKKWAQNPFDDEKSILFHSRSQFAEALATIPAEDVLDVLFNNPTWFGVGHPDPTFNLTNKVEFSKLKQRFFKIFKSPLTEYDLSERSGRIIDLRNYVMRLDEAQRIFVCENIKNKSEEKADIFLREINIANEEDKQRAWNYLNVVLLLFVELDCYENEEKIHLLAEGRFTEAGFIDYEKTIVRSPFPWYEQRVRELAQQLLD